MPERCEAVRLLQDLLRELRRESDLATPVEKAIETSVRPKTVPLNLQAFALGFEYTPERERTS